MIFHLYVLQISFQTSNKVRPCYAEFFLEIKNEHEKDRLLKHFKKSLEELQAPSLSCYLLSPVSPHMLQILRS